MDRATFDRYLESYNRGDLEACSEFYADDIVFENFGGHQEGPEVLAFLRQLHEWIDDTMVPRTVIVDGDHIAMECDTELVAKMDLPNLPIGAMVEGERAVARTFVFYDTDGDTIKHIRIAGWPPAAQD